LRGPEVLTARRAADPPIHSSNRLYDLFSFVAYKIIVAGTFPYQ
jgi:hypothetical protein